TIKFLNKEIVIEGVEVEELLASFPKEWLQQTYYYDKPHSF
ncbi:MAG: EAL domain-containing protein, partial [Lactococcus sp.]